MTLASKVSAAQDALVAVLDAVVDLNVYGVVYGFPFPIPEMSIFVGEDATTERETPFSGAIAAQDETFTLSVFLHVHRTALTALQVRAIADAGEALILATLAANPTLSGAVSYCVVAAIERKGGIWDDAGKQRFADRKIDVKCTAYLG